MKLALIIGSIAIVIILVLAVGLSQTRESPHDRDLRDCRERYGISSPYVEAWVRAEAAATVAACMRGRGY